jgi:hypothetical protein
MTQILWFMLTWIAGTAAILGSLMTLGSLLLWLAPLQSRSRKTDASLGSMPSQWQNRLKLLAFSVAIALAGLGILLVVPFPSF